MNERSTIQIPKALREEIKSKKRFKRETYEEVLKRLLKQDKKMLEGK